MQIQCRWQHNWRRCQVQSKKDNYFASLNFSKTYSVEYSVEKIDFAKSDKRFGCIVHKHYTPALLPWLCLAYGLKMVVCQAKAWATNIFTPKLVGHWEQYRGRGSLLKIPQWEPLFFCILENSGGNYGQAIIWSLSALLSRAWKPHIFPVSWCNLKLIQLSIKSAMWTAQIYYFRPLNSSPCICPATKNFAGHATQFWNIAGSIQEYLASKIVFMQENYLKDWAWITPSKTFSTNKKRLEEGFKDLHNLQPTAGLSLCRFTVKLWQRAMAS